MMGDLPGLVHWSERRGRLAEGQDALRGRDVLVAALKSRYFRHRCYRCFLHSVSSVTINEVTDQSGADVVAVASLLGAHGCVTAAISFVGIGIMRHMDCFILCFRRHNA